MLMMVITGEDLRLGKDHQKERDTQYIDIADEKIESKVQCTKAENEEYWPTICGMFKHC